MKLKGVNSNRPQTIPMSAMESGQVGRVSSSYGSPEAGAVVARFGDRKGMSVVVALDRKDVFWIDYSVDINTTPVELYPEGTVLEFEV